MESYGSLWKTQEHSIVRLCKRRKKRPGISYREGEEGNWVTEETVRDTTCPMTHPLVSAIKHSDSYYQWTTSATDITSNELTKEGRFLNPLGSVTHACALGLECLYLTIADTISHLAQLDRRHRSAHIAVTSLFAALPSLSRTCFQDAPSFLVLRTISIDHK